MPSFCSSCGASGQRLLTHCSACGESMLVSHEDIENIKAELLELKVSIEQKITHFETQLTAVESRFDGQTTASDLTVYPQEEVYEDSFKEIYEIEEEFMAQLYAESPQNELSGTELDEANQENAIIESDERPQEIVETNTNETPSVENDNLEEVLEENPVVFEEAQEYLQLMKDEEALENIVPTDDEIEQVSQDYVQEVIEDDVNEVVEDELLVIEDEAQELIEIPQPVLDDINLDTVEVTTEATSGMKELFGEAFFAPVVQFKQYVRETYLHYKQQNKLPIFFMTIGGIAALLFGFGYLMQATSGFYFELAKTVGGFTTAGLVILWGKTLIKKHTEFSEFGSALFGLGISLSYLMLYFLNSSAVFPFFGSPAIGLLMVLMNTLLATWLALRFETRIVAVLSLVGGAFAPFYLSSELVSPFYFAYLWILSIASIYIGEKINWKALGTLAFLVSMGVIEYVVWTSAEELPLLTFTLIFHAFAYLFLYYALFERKNPKFELNREEVFVLAVSVSSFVFNLYILHEVYDAYNLLGIIYLVNASVMILGFFFLKKRLPKRMHLLFFILAGTFAGLAVPALFGQEFMALFWAIEGIALVACGFIFQMSGVRREGYIVGLIALGRSLFSWPEMIQNWGNTLWTEGFANFLVLGALILMLWGVLRKYQDEQLKFERVLSKVLFESLTFWAWGVWAIAGWYYLNTAWYNWNMIPMLALVWWGNRHQSKLTEWLGLASYAWLVTAMVLSMQEVESLRFYEQTLLGKIAMIEVLLPLWGLQLFYEKLLPGNKNLRLMRILREAFYMLLPWVVLSPIRRHVPVLLPIGFALSASLAFVLWELLKHKDMIFAKKYIRNQAYLLVGLSTVFCFHTFPQVLTDYNQTIWHWGFYNFLALGGIYSALRWYINKSRADRTETEMRFAHAILEGVSVWFTTVYMIVGFHYIPTWMPVLAPIGIFGWLWWAGKKELVVTEMLGLAHYGLVLFPMIYQALFEAQSVSFLEQQPIGMMLMVESVVLLWAIPFFYKPMLKKGFFKEVMPTVEALFFLAIPVVALPTCFVHLSDLGLISSLWVSVIICFALNEWLKKTYLQFELYGLVGLSTLSIFMDSILGGFIGLVVLFGIYFYKKGFLLSSYLTRSSEESSEKGKPPYRYLFAYAFYYLGLCIMLLYGKIMNEVGGMLLIGGAYLYGITFFRGSIHALRSNFKFAYRVGNVLMALGLLVVIAEGFFEVGLVVNPGQVVLAMILAIGGITLHGLMAYNPTGKLALVKDKLFWPADVIMFHVFTIATYAGFIHLLSESWDGVVLTVFLTIHSIVLLFNSANPKYKFLMRFSIILFIGTAIKLKFYDMGNLGTVPQIIVLMLVGVLLLIGANLFAKFRKRWESIEV